MRKSRQILHNQTQLIRELQETNQLLKSIPEQIAHASGTVSIQNLNIEQATLDKLLFQLDKIDVKDLSGTLNLGNNFQLDKADKQTTSNRLIGLNRLIQRGAAFEDPALEMNEPPSHEEPGTVMDNAQVKSTEQGFVVRVAGD